MGFVMFRGRSSTRQSACVAYKLLRVRFSPAPSVIKCDTGKKDKKRDRVLATRQAHNLFILVQIQIPLLARARVTRGCESLTASRVHTPPGVLLPTSPKWKGPRFVIEFYISRRFCRFKSCRRLISINKGEQKHEISLQGTNFYI